MGAIIRSAGKKFLGKRDPRYIKGYPRRATKMIRRKKRGAIKNELLRQPRPRRGSRSRFITRFDTAADMERRAADNVYGSLEERIVYQTLINYDFLPGFDFQFQSSQLGGRGFLGGLVADFLFPYSKVIIQVQSYWHLISSDHQQRDTDQSLILQSMGYTVMELWPETLHSEAALDQWMERNITTLQGNSKEPHGLYYRSRDDAFETAVGSQLPPNHDLFTTLHNLERNTL